MIEQLPLFKEEEPHLSTQPNGRVIHGISSFIEGGLRVGVVGATGLVGRTLIEVLKERNLKVGLLRLFSSGGGQETWLDTPWGDIALEKLQNSTLKGLDLVFLAVERNVAKEWGWKFWRSGAVVIDKSSYFREKGFVPLIIPEVNGEELKSHRGIIASPNCVVIPLVVTLAPLHRQFGLRWVALVSLQSVSGAGKRGLETLRNEQEKLPYESSPFPQSIWDNLIPWIGAYSRPHSEEEIKIVKETRRLLKTPRLPLMATSVRVPITVGHCISVTCEFKHSFTLDEVLTLWRGVSGIIIADDPSTGQLPTPLVARGSDWVWVGRVRGYRSRKRLSFFIASDNLRKGAATNAVQITEYLVKEGLVKVVKESSPLSSSVF